MEMKTKSPDVKYAGLFLIAPSYNQVVVQWFYKSWRYGYNH